MYVPLCACAGVSLSSPLTPHVKTIDDIRQLRMQRQALLAPHHRVSTSNECEGCLLHLVQARAEEAILVARIPHFHAIEEDVHPELHGDALEFHHGL